MPSNPITGPHSDSLAAASENSRVKKFKERQAAGTAAQPTEAPAAANHVPTVATGRRPTQTTPAPEAHSHVGTQGSFPSYTHPASSTQNGLPALTMPPIQTGNPLKDEALANMLQAWYWTGFYAGVHAKNVC